MAKNTKCSSCGRTEWEGLKHAGAADCQRAADDAARVSSLVAFLAGGGK